MNIDSLISIKEKLLKHLDSKESHVEYYGKYNQCETYYLYISEIEDIIEEFFDKEIENIT